MNEKRPKTGTGGKSQRKPASATAGDGGPMDVGLLEQIVKLMAANDLNTVDLRDGDKRVILRRGALPAAGPAPVTHYPAAAPAPTPQTSGEAPRPAAAEAGGAAGGQGLVTIRAEMVGTFYAAPKPGEPPFVNVGSSVDEETDVCLIEAMKNYFPVKAGVRGTIVKVLVQTGETVQFDQPLFHVKPA